MWIDKEWSVGSTIEREVKQPPIFSKESFTKDNQMIFIEIKNVRVHIIWRYNPNKICYPNKTLLKVDIEWKQKKEEKNSSLSKSNEKGNQIN